MKLGKPAQSAAKNKKDISSQEEEEEEESEHSETPASSSKSKVSFSKDKKTSKKSSRSDSVNSSDSEKPAKKAPSRIESAQPTFAKKPEIVSPKTEEKRSKNEIEKLPATPQIESSEESLNKTNPDEKKNEDIPQSEASTSLRNPKANQYSQQKMVSSSSTSSKDNKSANQTKLRPPSSNKGFDRPASSVKINPKVPSVSKNMDSKVSNQENSDQRKQPSSQFKPANPPPTYSPPAPIQTMPRLDLFPMRELYESSLTPALLAGLKEIGKQKPKDPVKFLGKFLTEYSG